MKICHPLSAPWRRENKSHKSIILVVQDAIAILGKIVGEISAQVKRHFDRVVALGQIS